jgi:hypothetical protein
MLEFQFARGLLHAKYDLDRFQLYLKRLDALDFPSASAKDRIQHLGKQLGDTESKLKAIEQDYSADPIGASDRLVSEYRKLVRNRSQLEVLDRARSDEVPWSLVPSIEKLANQIMPSRDLLLTTTPDMNYMVSWSPSAAHNFVTIYLPGLHRANAFLHILIAHELFHPIVEPFVVSEQSNIDTKLRDECKKLVGKSAQPLFDQQRLDQLVHYTLQAWQQILRELMCDMGAVAIFGPAALWTISSFAATCELDLEPAPETQFYPPWRRRLATAIEYLKEKEDLENKLNQLAETLREATHTTHADAVLAGIQDEEKLTKVPTAAPTNPLIQIAYDCMNESLDRAKSEVKRLSESYPRRWSSSIEEVASLIGRLELMVPPCEIIESGKHESQPASFSAILTAAWVKRLTLETTGLELSKYRELCRLTLKAIEDADLKSDFLAWKGTQ